MTSHILKAEQLKQEKFATFGEVIELELHDNVKSISHNQSQHFTNFVKSDLSNKNGKPFFILLRCEPNLLPSNMEVIERHSVSNQFNYPMTTIVLLVLVSMNSDQLSPGGLRLFFTNGSQGVNFVPKIWHHYLLAIEQVAEFVVVDRGAIYKNCNKYF